MTDLKAKTPKKPEKPVAEGAIVQASASPPYVIKDGVIEAGGGVEDAPPVQKPFDPAAWMHQRIVHQIVEFEKHLGDDHELGGRFVEGPGNDALHITNVASWGPDMIVFIGEYSDGRRFELIQHYSQVSVLLLAVPKAKNAPRRIGFELMKAVKDQVHPWGDPVS